MPLTVDKTGSPIRVTGTTDADTEIIPDIVFVKFVKWFDASTSGDLCTLKDTSGRFIIEMRASKANDTQNWPIYTTFTGINCDDMDSGTLYIYIP